jgi:hypothetical protein
MNPDDWADAVHVEIKANNVDASHLTQLASYYLSHLVIPCKSSLLTRSLELWFSACDLQVRNPSGKSTPQDSIYPSPRPTQITEIAVLLQKATVDQSQSALRDLARLTY